MPPVLFRGLNMAVFPHMDGNQFPHIDNVDVNKYVNEFDYSLYNEPQMKLTLCAVPWDMGEAHVGNRTISGIGNVVYFETKEKRDEWFSNIPDDECLRFETKYKELHRDLLIDVPVPFDVAAKYNYLAVEYSLFANDNAPVMYETADGVRKWFWFVREVEYLAPNTTRLHLLDDAWQTWIYDVDITGMILERGHAPMFETSADEYLSNPIDHNANLLAEDVNYGEAVISKTSDEFIFNSGNMYAIIITTGSTGSNWGSKSANTWRTPALTIGYRIQGVPSYDAFAVKVSNFSEFMRNANNDYPQFIQTIKAVAFVSGDLLSFTRSYTFAGVTCYDLNANYVQNELCAITKDKFGYSPNYADIAKLYTYPYSYILVTDEQGNGTEIRIETTDGTINIESTVSLVFPWLSINAHLSGIGKAGRKNITFVNVNPRNMPIQGNWYETLRSWDIPTFGIYQNAETNNDYATHFDRLQQSIAANNAYSNVVASANCLVDNADLQIAANEAVTETSNEASATDTANINSTSQALQAWDSGYARDTTNNSVNAQYASAAVGAAGGVAGSIASGARTGGLAGAIGGLIDGAINGATTMAQTTIAVNLTTTQAETTITYTQNKVDASNGSNSDRNEIQINANEENTETKNDYIEASTANTAAMQIANGGRDYSTATNAIANQIAQAALNAPVEFGAWQAGDLVTSRPQGLFANVVTQTDAAISAAGDEMLRYGYMLNKYWQFDGNWNIGKHYTYWKLRDFWVNALNVPDMYMDKLRFFLFGGVTVWRNPSDIGKTTIYENL